ncbi:chitin synthase [Fusarium flagelliforme]|uniref:chitin synthase n=1 Tax=Fusarium flagelliforme TaxID=2675880 RepID=A0A395N187_9HYPO|nr:chitin synthase [Fusarium flagelliforme]
MEASRITDTIVKKQHWQGPAPQRGKGTPPPPSFFSRGASSKFVFKDIDGHFHDLKLGEILQRTSFGDTRSSDESLGPSVFTASPSYKSSFSQTPIASLNSFYPHRKHGSPSISGSSHNGRLIIPRTRLPDPVAQRRDSGSLYSVEDISIEAHKYAATATQTSPRNSILEQNTVDPTPKVEIDSESQNLDEYLRKYGQRKVTRHKWIMTGFLVSVKNLIKAEKIIEPDHIENLVMIMPCYNETLEECTKSLDSLVNQVGIDNHKRGIMVICDGRFRGPGMEKTTAQYLKGDIFVGKIHPEKIRGAYKAWDGQAMDVDISWSYYKGVPFYCIIKEQNQGKRDSLIVVRSFLYKFNIRNTNPTTIFSSRFLLSMTNWFTQEVKVNEVDHLIGMDADTVFDETWISELLKESKYPNTVGVCGYVAVDFSGGNWNLWSIYQNAEYTIAQGLRRLHQSIATKKVSCLPGCCQLLKICGMTCGDKVLIEQFGYYPRPLDGMIKRIRATASEDRNHICQLLTTFPEAQTRQALRARAYTDVPHS